MSTTVGQVLDCAECAVLFDGAPLSECPLMGSLCDSHGTNDMTMNFAKTLVKVNGEKSKEITFCYVSGAGTDSTEKGKTMWARVKGKTENDLMNLPFKNAYMFRPGYIQPTKGLKNTYTVYKFITPLYPLLKTLFPKYTVTLKEVGQAMINVALYSPEKKVLECADIREAAVVRDE